MATVALAVTVLIAVALRLWRIDSLPPGFHFDESFEGLEAWRILTDPGYRPIFLSGNFGVPPLNAYANAVTFALFGLFGAEAGPTAMRTTAAIAGVAGVLAVFALATELRHLDPRRLTAAFPVLAAAVLATLRWHIHFSRMGIEPVFVPLLWAAAAWLLLRGWRLQSWVSFAGCGLMLALAMYTYQGAWIIPFLMIPVVLHLRLSDRSERRTARLRGPAVAAGVALLLASQQAEGASAAMPILLTATALLGLGFGLTVPALNTFAAAFFPAHVDRAILVLNALLGLGTALAPALVAVFTAIGAWWGLPVRRREHAIRLAAPFTSRKRRETGNRPGRLGISDLGIHNNRLPPALDS